MITYPRPAAQHRLRRRLTASVTATGLLLAAACGAGDNGSAADGTEGADGVTIGFDFPSQNQARWGFEAAAFQARAAENGDTVIIDYANFSTVKQKTDVDTMMQKGIDVLVIAPVDTTAAAALVIQAQAQGIKVITYDSAVVGAKPDYQVERDNTAAGRMHAEAALAAVPAGKYAIIRGDQSTSVAQGMGAAYDELLLANPGIEVVYDQWTPGWDSAQAQKNAEAALVANSNHIDAFVVSWDDGAQGVAQALKSAGVSADDVYVTGTDGAVPSLINIAAGWQDMSVWTRIDQMATSAADIAHALGTGQAVPTPDTTTQEGVPVKNAELIAVDEPGLCEFLTDIAPDGWATPQDILGSSTTCA